MVVDQYGKKWFKGNFHTHTTVSDGRKTPEEVMDLYQRHGYDFLALTDHWKLSTKGTYKNMLLFPGTELHTPQGPVWHIVGIDLDAIPEKDEKANDPQYLIDSIRSAGGLAILAHPAWSLDQPEDIVKLKGICGTEIYNSVSAPPHSARPDSSLILDLATVKGLRIPYMAADDAHFYDTDFCRSFMMVQADELTHESIREAIEQGRLYASQGPLISTKIEDGKLIVETDDASQVLFFSDTKYQRDTCTVGEHLTRAEFKLKASDLWVRAEVINAAGQHAWTSVMDVAHLF